MNIDELIRDIIDDEAGPAPAPDLDRIHRRGRRRAAVRVGGAAIATLAVVAAGTYAVQTVGGVTDEIAPANAPGGHSAAYLTSTDDGFVLNWAGHAIEAEHAGAAQMPAMTKAGLVYLADDGVPYLIDSSGEETALGDAVDHPPGEREGWAMVVSDTTGSHAAWAHYVRGEVTISLFDANTRRVTTSPTFDCAEIAAGCDYASAQVVDGGTVYVTASVDDGSRDSTIVWSPDRPQGERLYPLTDPGTSLAAAGPGQLVLDGPGDAYGGPDHAPLPATTDMSRLGSDEARDAESMPMSADGQWRVVDPQDFIGPERDRTTPIPVVQNVVTGRTVSIDVPDVDDVTFDADGSLLVIVRTADGQRMDDCEIPSGTCTTMIERIDGSDAVFADGGVM